MSKYAVVMSSDAGYLSGTTAVINGLDLYDNDVDVHLLPTPDVPKAYLNQLPDNCTVADWNSLPLEYIRTDTERGLPWQVRFFRYWYAAQICSNYSAIMILDSDCFVVGSVMESFATADRTGELVLVRNSIGHKIDDPLCGITKASHHPFHCHAAVFNCAKFRLLLGTVFDDGLKNSYGDMIALYFAIRNSDYDISRANILENELWCYTTWWTKPVVIEKDDQDLPVLFVGDPKKRMIVVHGKWFNDAYLHNEFRRVGGGDVGWNNLVLFRSTYDWLIENGKVCLPEDNL